MRRKYFEKKIYLDYYREKYCVVRLYNDKKEMQLHYKKVCRLDKGHFKVLGVHIPSDSMIKDGKIIWTKKTGIVLLSVGNCGAGVISHEFMHAVLWAWKNGKKKTQYPIVIKNMKQEETILYNLFYAVKTFYQWYFKLVKDNAIS